MVGVRAWLAIGSVGFTLSPWVWSCSNRSPLAKDDRACVIPACSLGFPLETTQTFCLSFAQEDVFGVRYIECLGIDNRGVVTRLGRQTEFRVHDRIDER